MPEILRFENVNFFRNGMPILQEISFEMQAGQSLAILGRNGAGKTTLVNLLFGYLWPTSGRVSAFGEEYGTTPIFPIQDQIGILQSSHQDALLQKSLTVLEVIITGMHKTLGLYKEVKPDEEKIARSRLQALGLSAKADQRYSTLSSGEKTQILLLRALGLGIKILILDEPTAALDFTARSQFEKSLDKIKKENPDLTRILITHRIEEVPDDFDTAMLLKSGKILDFGPKAKVFSNPNLSDLYDTSLAITKTKDRFFISEIRE
jgi:iron complex transport system ATP-binding protein